MSTSQLAARPARFGYQLRSSDTLYRPAFMLQQSQADTAYTKQATSPSTKIMSARAVATKNYNLTTSHDDLIEVSWLQDR
jgi:hypothetical protein